MAFITLNRIVVASWMLKTLVRALRRLIVDSLFHPLISFSQVWITLWTILLKALPSISLLPSRAKETNSSKLQELTMEIRSSISNLRFIFNSSSISNNSKLINFKISKQTKRLSWDKLQIKVLSISICFTRTMMLQGSAGLILQMILDWQANKIQCFYLIWLTRKEPSSFPKIIISRALCQRRLSSLY